MNILTPLGLVFFYRKDLGEISEVSSKVLQYVSDITNRLIAEGYFRSPQEFTYIAEKSSIFWTPLSDSDFKQLKLDGINQVARSACKIFKEHTGIEPSLDVKVLFCEEDNVPWKFDLILSALSLTRAKEDAEKLENI